jgi:hypothetical protein
VEVLTQKRQEPATQQLAKGPDANLTFDTSPKDHVRIREIFSKEPAGTKVDHVGFSLSAGTVVPHSVHLTPLPQTIVDIQPTWRGNKYFQIGDQIVIVDPRSMRIVGGLEAQHPQCSGAQTEPEIVLLRLRHVREITASSGYRPMAGRVIESQIGCWTTACPAP